MFKKLFHIPVDESDLFLCFGTESLFYGISMISPPAAFILVGVIFTALAFVQARA